MKIDPLALGSCQRKTLGAIFFERAISAERSGAIAFRMLDERGREVRSLTVRALHEEANRLASLIRARASPGDRVLLLHPPGLDFVVAFLLAFTPTPLRFRPIRRAGTRSSGVSSTSSPTASVRLS